MEKEIKGLLARLPGKMAIKKVSVCVCLCKYIYAFVQGNICSTQCYSLKLMPGL